VPLRAILLTLLLGRRVCDFCLIFVPFGHYDETEILPYENTSMCPKGADVRQLKRVFDRQMKVGDDGTLKIDLGELPLHEALIVDIL